MRSINGLITSLNGSLGLNKARINCFARMLLGMIAIRSVNLQEIALSFASDAKESSRYRRLQRFFAKVELDYVLLARWLFGLFIKPGGRCYMIIDRTHWYWGKQVKNVFMLSIAYEGLAIPLFWQVLNKEGSTGYEEQKALLAQFIHTFGNELIAGVLADREFANGKLFGYLLAQHIPFYIRIKENSQVTIKDKKWCKAKQLFNDLAVKTSQPFGMTVWVFGQKVYLTGARSERGELMIVASNAQPKQAIAIYLRRWEVENLFQGLKGRGFRFEDTHMTAPARIAKLMALLAIGFAWMHKVGEWLALQVPIRFKQFRQSKRPEHTFFRYGLDFMREMLLLGKHNTKQMKHCIQLLTITTPQRMAL